MDVELAIDTRTTQKLTIQSPSDDDLFTSTRGGFGNMGHAELLAHGLASPVSQAFGGSFTTFPVDNAQESNDSMKLSSPETHCEDAPTELNSSMHKPPLSKSETAKKLATSYRNLAILKQYVGIWNKPPGGTESQADTASSESRNSPQFQYQNQTQGIMTTLRQQARERIYSEQVGNQSVQISLQSQLKLADLNPKKQNGASLASDLLRRQEKQISRSDKPAETGFSDDQISNFSKQLISSFNDNLGQPKAPAQSPSIRPSQPRPMVSSNWLGVPAWHSLGMGGMNQQPSRAKAFSLQVTQAEGFSYSAEKKSHQGFKSTNNSPQVRPSNPACARSLLLEPDYEDLLSVLPGVTDYKYLDQNIDEEEHANGESNSELAESLLSSVFVPQPRPAETSAQLMTQKV